LEALTVFFGHDRQHHSAKPRQTVWIRAFKRPDEQSALGVYEFFKQRFAFLGYQQQSLPAIAGPYLLVDQTVVDQASEDSSETLLGDLERFQQMTNGDAAVGANEIQRTVVGATQVVLFENSIGYIREVSISKEHQLDGFAGRRI